MIEANGRVPVWDAAVRMGHWALAALVLFDWWRDDGDYVHRVAGYVAAGVVVVVVAARIHVAAVVAMSWLWRENLPAAMVTGRKRPPDEV